MRKNYICQAEESPGGLRDLPGCEEKDYLTIRCNALLVDGCADNDSGVRYNLALRFALSCVKETDHCSQHTATALRLVDSDAASATSRSKSACNNMVLQNSECKRIPSPIREFHLRLWYCHVVQLLSIMLKSSSLMLGMHSAHVCKLLSAHLTRHKSCP